MNFKKYKINKLKYILKNIKLIHICSYEITKIKNWKIKEQVLKKNKLKYYKTSNTILIKLLYNSIFKSTIPLINGPIILIYSTEITKNFNYNKLEKLLSSNIKILCSIINNKIYYETQLTNIFTTYDYNITLLTKLFNNINKKGIFRIKKLSIKN